MELINLDSEESSSGCESGWTLYLQHSNIPHHDHHHFSSKKTHNDLHEHEHEHDDGDDVDVDDDDDMSMVSDASSGPPHFQQDDEDECNNNINGGFGHLTNKRRKIFQETSFHSFQDLPASLDDTASSPFFSFSNKGLKGCNEEALMEDDNSFDYSQGHSTTYFEMV